ncbi:DUF6268 family outer membrane beta-barrel protein [Mesonia maritima]|uniref:DUF6268 domain-containing protein n=1 Tax=Mesonia maritima TaxID=1793873 RepID=A0ABU1K8G5_9FLAO|nr:DUF6268 family outer membrane beta-barrel protein [Mesonia maritima]MDR6301908.1 hypothetical protein [Mesonia maritima]
MKQLFFSIILVLIGNSVNAQISLKTEYLGTSKYHPEDVEKSSGKEGSAFVYQANLKLPLSISKDSLPKIWGVDISGALVDLDNTNLNQNEVFLILPTFRFRYFTFAP